MTRLYALLGALFLVSPVAAQSTSPVQARDVEARDAEARLAPAGDDAITFSEYPVGTAVGSQYRSRGIRFGGDAPFITTDGSNPTSPVLSGSPIFQGAIEGEFIVPDVSVNVPTVVTSFTFDAGYFDNFGSTRVEWFGPDGEKLGQATNSQLGIERMTFEGGNIASWRVEIVEDEPAGFALDNVSFEPVGPSLLFREKSGDEKDGTWGFGQDYIPGFDHVGLHVEDRVYESHPGYPAGRYQSADAGQFIEIADHDGVQWQHTRSTFEHDSKTRTSPVTRFREVPIPGDVAEAMRTAVESVDAATFQLIDLSFPDGIEQTLSPSAQKGGGGTFTCVGLVEWAAEQAGHNGGAGFVPDDWESVTVLGVEVPLLAPEFLYWAAQTELVAFDAVQAIRGYFDPVDYAVTDPLGRVLSVVGGVTVADEIPGAFHTADGDMEQFLIPNPVPGPYRVQLFGTGADAVAGVTDGDGTVAFSGYLDAGAPVDRALTVATRAGSRGDVDEDADVDLDDVEALVPLLNRFTDRLGHPGDLDGDGLLSDADVDLLTALVGAITTDVEAPPSLEASMGPAYPNPTAARAAVPVVLGRAQHVRLDVVDALGRVVLTLADETWPAGTTTATVRADDLPAGVYVVRLQTEAGVTSRPVSIVR